VPVAAFLAWVLVPRAPFGFDGWRWVVLAGSVGAGVVWYIRLQVPESPRWLAAHGRIAEAETIVAQFETEEGIQKASISAGHYAPDEETHGGLLEIWRPPYLSRTVMLILFNLFQTVGFYGFSNWVPTFLISQGITVTKSLQYTFIIALAAPCGPLLASLFTDRIERKWAIVAAAGCVAGFGLVFGHMTAAAPLILFGVLVTLANNMMSFSFHAYQAELYPTRIRATAVGFVYSFSRLSTVFSAFLIAFVLRRFAVSGVFVMIAASMVVVMLAIGLLGPKVRNLALEDVSH
jgi:putative MFS transporter